MNRFASQFLLLAMLLTSLTAAAFDGTPSFRRYNTNDGLPSNCVRSILQSSDNFMWFATDGGLARFDGRTFKVFTPSTIEGVECEDDFVSNIVESDGRLWVSTDSYILEYDPRMERLILPELVYQASDTCRISSPVKSVAVDHSGYLWVASDGVYCISTETLQVRHFETAPAMRYPGVVFVDSSNNVWISGHRGEGGLYRLDKSGGTFRQIPVTVDGTPVDVHCMAIEEDDDHNLWLGLWDDGLLKVDPLTGDAERRVNENTRRDLLHVHSLCRYGDDRMLIGSDLGMGLYDIKTRRYTLFAPDELDPASISGSFVYPIVCDKEGGVWLGTFYAGVSYMLPETKRFDNSVHSRLYNSVSGNVISSFCEDSRGNIYIGSDDGGLCRYSPVDGKYTHIPLESGQSDGYKENVHALGLDGNRLWIGTYGGGIIAYDTSTGRISRRYRLGESLSGDMLSSCYSIYIDRNDCLWATSMNSVYRYDRTSDRFFLVKNLGGWTVDIDEDSRGRLWFSTQGRGLFCFDQASGEWKHYVHSKRDGALLNNHVSCVYIDGNEMYVATVKGLCTYNADTDRFEPIDLGVPRSSLICSVIKDGDVLWISTLGGLLRRSPDGTVHTFTERDGLISRQFNINSVLRASSGRIFMGTVNGYTSFMPHRIQPNRYVPDVRFTSLDIVNHNVSTGDLHLPQSLNHVDHLEITPDDYQLTISFAALSYVNPEENRYRYMLEGFDKEWVDAGSSGMATYTNLPAGSYRLQVQGSNNDGVWNNEGAELQIKVLPAWYARWYMQMIYILLGLALLFGFIYLVLRHNEREHRKELTRIRLDREKEVFQAKLSFFTMIAHEIRTPVSLIIGPLEKIMKKCDNLPSEVDSDLHIIERNSERLLLLVNQLLDFKKVEQKALTVSFEPTDICRLLESVADRFRPSVEQRGGHIELTCPRGQLIADVDAEAITKLVSNLMNNARKFTRNLIVVHCDLDDSGDTFTISVTDNGVGITADNIRRIFKPFYQVESTETGNGEGTGLGLSIVKSVVEAHHGTINVDSEPGNGATFTVCLPLRQDGAPATLLSETTDEKEPTLPVEEADSASPAPDENSKPVMLIVDDQEELLDFLKNSFADRYDVITASNGEDALALLSSHNVDLIVSDWIMPVMDGVTFCRRVRTDRRWSHIPFVLLTAKTDKFSKIEGINCGADAYIEKPFSLDYLEVRLRNLIEMRRLLMKKFSQAPLEPITTIAPTQVDNEFLTQLTQIIEENFNNPDLSVDFLASKMCISRSGLYSKIKTLAQVTPNELIQIARLKKAAQLLTLNKYRISEICYMVGFNSASYFAKCFQKQFGMKPGEFYQSTVSPDQG